MRLSLLLILCLTMTLSFSQNRPTSTPPPDTVYLLKPAHVFDGDSAQLHDDWVVLVRNQKIEAAGPASSITACNAQVIDLPGLTLLPGPSKLTRTSCFIHTARQSGTIKLRTSH
jgi:hypothetical protein